MVYIILQGVIDMDVAKVFETGRSQAVRLPKKFRFEESEVLVQRLGDVVMLAPKDAAWKVFMEGLGDFTDDFFADGREQGVQPERDLL